MPDLSSTLILDLLLGLIIVLFVPFGIRRGAAKEAMGSAGLLLGAAFADAWASTVARWLSDLLGLSRPTASFVVTLGFLLIGMFVIGYGGGAALGRTNPGWLSRIVGGVIAALNAALLLSLSLEAVQRNLQTDGLLADGVVSGLLMNRRDLLLLGAVCAMLVFVVGGWIVNLFRGDRSAQDSAALGRRERPVRTPTAADQGKYEPMPARPTPSMSQTAPIPNPGDPWQRPSGNGGQAAAPVNPWMSWGQQAGDPRRGGGSSMESMIEVRRTCPTCGATAAATDVFCQECGKTL